MNHKLNAELIISMKICALLEAKSGADLPILKNHDGFISESSGTLLQVKMDYLTPSLDCDILESITRHCY